MLFYLIKGGPLLIAIALCSVLAGACSIIQWLRLRRASRDLTKQIVQIERLIRKRDWTQSLELSSHENHPFLRTWCTGFELLAEGKSDLRDIEGTVSIEGARTVAHLESMLKPIGTMTTILPMLGFLGTILGLIISFHNWEQMDAHVSISQLAGGIYQAMITTAAGLITAIPYYLIHHYFTARTEACALNLSKMTTELFRWIRDALLGEMPVESEAVLNSLNPVPPRSRV